MDGTDARQKKLLAAAALGCVAAPSVHLLAFGTAIPEGTFMLLSRLGDSPAALDPGNVAYSLARPPVFALMGWTFWYPLAYLVVGYLSHVVLQGLFVWLAFLGMTQARPSASFESRLLGACLLGLSAFPLLHFAGFDDRGVSLVPHDSVLVFSHRTWFWGLGAVATGALVLGKPRLALGATAASSFVHPSAGILSLGLVAGLVGVPALLRRAWRSVLEVAGAVVVGLLPALLKTLFTSRPEELAAEVAYGDWYSAMIKDEADDFSFLFQLVYREPLGQKIIAFTLFVCVVYALAVRGGVRHVVLWAAALPPLAFLLGVLTELVFAIGRPTPLVHLIVALTPGYRLLSYAFFPALVLVGHLVALAAGRVHGRGALAVLERRLLPASVAVLGLVWVALLLANRGNARPALKYVPWAVTAGRVSGIDQYLLAAERAGMDEFKVPRVFSLAAPPVRYPGERSLLEIRERDREQPRGARDPSLEPITAERFADIVAAVRARAKPGTGVVIPPYLFYFRDALVDYPIFFQEHHDGNVMMGGPEVFGFFRTRMVDLMGFDYEGMPSKHSGLSFTAMRSAYLSLDELELARFRAKYPEYPLLLTEAKRHLPFAVVAENPAFVLYDLRAPVAKADRR